MAYFRCMVGSGGSGGGNLTDQNYDGDTMLIANQYIDVNGTISSYNGWSLTDYIDVGNNSTIYAFSTMANGQINRQYTACYDENKTALRTAVTVLGGLVTLPTGTKYIRISESTTFMSGLKVIMEA